MSESVVIVTDSAASIPDELVSRFGIVVVPMSVVVGGAVHADGDLSMVEVMARVREGLSTSAPSPGEFLDALRAHQREAGALVLTVSKDMSACFKAASTAARMVDGNVRVFDTGTAAGGQGLVVLAAAEAAAAGASLEEVEAAARVAAARVRLVATMESLDRLAASGRVPNVAALAGRWVGLRPLFEFREGRARPLRPAFSREAALDRIVASWRVSRIDGARLHVAALHAQAEEEAKRLLEAVAGDVEPATAFVAAFSSVMVVHTGLGLVGLAWWWEQTS